MRVTLVGPAKEAPLKALSVLPQSTENIFPTSLFPMQFSYPSDL